MKIVPLNCPNCGKRLEIGENKEQLACGACGSQLYVDRSGGTISLELAKSLGAISTGAAQTAAELAIVRLEKEFGSVFIEVSSHEFEIDTITSNLSNALSIYTSTKQYEMSDEEFSLAQKRVKTLEVDIKNWGGNVTNIVTIGFIIVCIIAALIYGQGKWLSVVGWLIGFGVIGFILMMIFDYIFLELIEVPRTKRLESILKDLKHQILLHQGSIELRER